MAKHDSDASTQRTHSARRGSASSGKVKRESPATAAPKKERRSFRQIAMTVIVVFFAILMAASVMIPSLAQVFSSNEQRRQAEEAAAQAAAAAEGSGSAATPNYDLSTVDGILDAYSTQIAEYEQRLQSDPENLAYILNVAQAYMNCAYNAAQRASTDEEATKVVPFFQTAEEYFDQYLAIKETNAVKVDHALCELYQGNIEQAVAELRAITQDSPDYAPAWMNLGMAYEVVSENQLALAAYGKAQETDPDNAYGARFFATNRISQIQSTLQSEEQSYNNPTDQSASDGVLNLWTDLANGGSTATVTSTSETEGE